MEGVVTELSNQVTSEPHQKRWTLSLQYNSAISSPLAFF